MKFYEINENMARTAKRLNSFFDYKEGSETENYRKEVKRIWEIGECAKQRVEKSKYEYIDMLVNRYSLKYADYLNKGFRIESFYPSVMVCGAGNFNYRKKEKQNSMRENHYRNRIYFENLEKKIRYIGTSAEMIKSSDPMAIDKLQNEIDELIIKKEAYKAANAYYKKHKNLDGFFDLSEEVKERHFELCKSYNSDYINFSTVNINQNIRRLTERIKSIESMKQSEWTYESKICKVEEDKEEMRIKLFFEEIPDNNQRTILKKNGFKWSGKNKAWQRQLTTNGRASVKYVLKILEENMK